jgi:hypothetical protein
LHSGLHEKESPDHHRFPAHWRLQLRRRPVRGGCADPDRELLPVQALPASQRSSGVGERAHPAEGTFRIVAGEDRLRMWKPDVGGEKWFCGDCGSSLFGRNPTHPDAIGIRMGTFDGDPGVRPSVRQFVRDAAPWEPIPDDGLPRHPESRHAKS